MQCSRNFSIKSQSSTRPCRTGYWKHNYIEAMFQCHDLSIIYVYNLSHFDGIGVANIHGLVPDVKVQVLHSSGGAPLVPHLHWALQHHADRILISIILYGKRKGLEEIQKRQSVTLAVSLTAMALGMMNWGSLLPAKPIFVYLVLNFFIEPKVFPTQKYLFPPKPLLN